MPKISRYNGNVRAFAVDAQSTERTVFGELTQANDLDSQFTADFLRGWGIVGASDQPSLQDFNAMGYTLGQLIAYLHQVGVPEYNAAQEYYLNSVTQSGGRLYISLINANVGNNPSANPTAWLVVSAIAATETDAGSAEIATQAETETGTDDARIVTPKKLAAWFANAARQASETVRGLLAIATTAEVTAGTNDNKAVTPLKLQQKVAAIVNNSVGNNQTYQDVTATRVSGGQYTNTTGRPIMAYISATFTSGVDRFTVTVGGVTIYDGDAGVNGQTTLTSFMVPNGMTYIATAVTGVSITRWVELR